MRNAKWSELLQASGVPSPLEVRDASEVPEGARLVVYDGPVAAAPTAPERAVLVIVRGAARPARELRWGALVVPLVGFDVTPLVLEEGERVVATDDAGQVIAALRSFQGAVRVRLGIDLAEALWRLRYGSPSNADRDVDRNGALQPADLAPVLPAEAIARPFADELLAAILADLDRSLACPLPRTRGLPEGVDSLLVVTSDQDFADDAAVLSMAEALALRGARATFLLTEPSIGLPADLNVGTRGAPRLDPETANALLAAGHDVSVHPFPRDAGDVVRHIDYIAQRHGLSPLIARNHHLRWFGYLDIPRAEAARGVALNLDTMPVGDGTRPCVGFPGGASQPVMFVGDDGSRVPLLQQTTSVDDYSLRVRDYSQLAQAATLLSTAARRTIAAARAAQVPVVLNAHPIFYRFAPGWLGAVLDAPDLHAVSATDWLAFVINRRAARIPAARCGQPVVPTLRSGVALRSM
ncbi:MAG: hypothetical protein KA978_06710 [Deltaproteobacteria bacterium]|nr:hypothetical protein [Deltaproteobacteria bacterium]